MEQNQKIGFRDDFIYNFIRNSNSGEALSLARMDREECLELFKEYKEQNKTIY